MPFTPCPLLPCQTREPATAREVDAETEALIHALHAARRQAERVRLGYVRVDLAGGFTGQHYIDPADLRAFENQPQGVWAALEELTEVLDRHWSAASPAELRYARRAAECAEGEDA
ncbi:hypothetical protein AB0E52_09300 [Micrococcus luteus]|uniref:hypothetical protein n=1 Tax=Micrococcus luteus TaxID=1270 RepID=UPI0033C590F3